MEIIGDNATKINVISDHFKNVFQSANAIKLPEIQPQKLQQPFTECEVRKAIKSLKNNKSGGCDLVKAEHLKHAPTEVYIEIANILNCAVETGVFPR